MNTLRSRTVALIAALALLLSLGASPAVADEHTNPPSDQCENTWVELDWGMWSYQDDQCNLLKDRWLQDNGSWYYLDANGVMASYGLYEINGTSYYFYGSGIMATGWFEPHPYGPSWYAESSGAVLMNTSRTYDGKKYYIGSSTSEHMYPFVYDTASLDAVVSADVYYVKNHSTIATGWFQHDGEWYYADSTGKLARDEWRYINGRWYHFNYFAAMSNDKLILNDNGKTSYVTDTGAMATGWTITPNFLSKMPEYVPSREWSYADASGYLAEDEWRLINGTWYYFMRYWIVTDQIHFVNSLPYYFNSSGAMATGWVYARHDWSWEEQLGQTAPSYGPAPERYGWYYADPSGALVTNAWRYVGGKWYYFGYYGQMYYSTIQRINTAQGPQYFRFDSSGWAIPFAWIPPK
ncbi:MAG: hypothetical protein GX483_08240 [Actinomycetaceae bacterium]|nr:hypothetical protein [Actinomycetaceae bacterium]